MKEVYCFIENNIWQLTAVCFIIAFFAFCKYYSKIVISKIDEELKEND